ncbi:TPA: GNAT family N-acetyltransferase, partial [Listeria monocytogenes]|nr:GNAT family N-acetyltransferase [Listeria monocytogenes]
PKFQGHGYAVSATKLAMKYAFHVLNMHKLYLVVDKVNEKAIHVYEKVGFIREGELIDEFFVDGTYHDAIRMCIFQHQYREMDI